MPLGGTARNKLGERLGFAAAVHGPVMFRGEKPWTALACHSWTASMAAHCGGAIRLSTLRVRLSRMTHTVNTSNPIASATTALGRALDASKKPVDIMNVSETELRILSPT